MAGTQDSLFRSAVMRLVQLYVPTEIGRETVSALGEVGQMQFRDVRTRIARKCSGGANVWIVE